MKRRHFLKQSILSSIALTGITLANRYETKTPKPNIVIILADDMGYGDISGINPKSKIQTPNIDVFLKKSMLFTEAHSNSAVCTPTRYGILTGRYCWRTSLKQGVLSGYGEPLIKDNRVTLPEFLKEQGYSTACVGKWHLGMNWTTTNGEYPKDNGSNVDHNKAVTGGPCDNGFDFFFGISASNNMPPYCFIENRHTVGDLTEIKFPIRNGQKKAPMVKGWQDDQVGLKFTEKACNWLKQQSNTQPFFLYLTSEAPHQPCVPAKQFKGKSGAGLRGDMVLEFDWTVGKIINTLEDLNVRDNTLIIISSDNGGLMGDPQWYYKDLPRFKGQEIVNGWVTYNHKPNIDRRGIKADIWDGGHRVPLIAHWPKHIKAGTESSELICLTDIFATVAAITKKPLAKDMAEDSFNCLPLLEGNKIPVRESLIHHSVKGMFALRTKRWKFIEGIGSGGFHPTEQKEDLGQLYDMYDDPQETTNLYSTHPDIVKKFKAKLAKIKDTPTAPHT